MARGPGDRDGTTVTPVKPPIEPTEPEVAALGSDAADDGLTTMLRAYQAQYAGDPARAPEPQQPPAASYADDLVDASWVAPAPPPLPPPPPPPVPAAEADLTTIAPVFARTPSRPQEPASDLPPILRADVVEPDEDEAEWWGDAAAGPDWDGDAPLAAPLDAPRTRALKPSSGDVFDRKTGRRAVLPGLPATAPGVETHARRARRGGPRGSLTVSELARRAEQARTSAAPASPPPAVTTEPRASRPALPARQPPPPANSPAEGSGLSSAAHRPGHRRTYPKMIALLQNPELVPIGSDPIPEPKPPPVPGTFIRSPPPEPKRKQPRRDASDMDAMLAAMAEGLFIGGDGQGNSEVLVTLRDEFFAGTELRVGIENGQVVAKLCPPDRDTWRHLSSEIHRLRARLEERGLRVGALSVVEP